VTFTARPRTLLTLLAGSVLGFCGALAGGVLAERPQAAPRAAQSLLPGAEASQFADVYARIKREYVDEVDDRVLMDKAMRGMVAALDPHSAYLDSDEFNDIRLSTMGSYPGVGIEVAATNGVVKVLKPIEGTPARAAGILAGDELVAIDGREIGADLAGAIARLRGAAGSVVRLSIHRDGTPGVLDFSLRRAEVEVHSVAAATLEPGYGYVRISTFSQTTPDDLNRAVLRLKRDNPEGIKGLILDLRNNPGGVLESGVAVADAFLESGVIVTADGRTPDSRFEMDATAGDLIEGAPLVVLVNAGSASASEIVAGALKDHARALLVGRRTYGKGSVQTVMPLARGGAVKLTTSRYFTPSGASIQGKGLTPDILEEGSGVAPAEMPSAEEQTPLSARDADVRLGLQSLKNGAARLKDPSALTARLAVP
jgi:carboxyl-terminal processing protease